MFSFKIVDITIYYRELIRKYVYMLPLHSNNESV